MNRRISKRILVAAFAAASVFMTSAVAHRPQDQIDLKGRDVTILVTAHPDSDRSRAVADRLKPEDFSVRENKQLQQIISVKRPMEAPLILAVLIQDDLISRVNNEIRGIKDFIRKLPDGSRVMTAYISVGSLRIRQEFTADRERAAESLRILISSLTSSAYSPYEEVLDALKHFDSETAGRRIVLLVSDGLDTSQGLRSASPMMSVYLERAIDEAQRRGISIFTFYAPSVGLTSRSHLAMTYGQGSLNRIADETGGEAFFAGSSFVSFDPYFREFNELLGRQWLITYRSSNFEAGFRKIEVKTDYDLELLHPAGYRLRSKDIPRP